MRLAILCLAAVALLARKPHGRPVIIVDLARGTNRALLVGACEGDRWIEDKQFHGSVHGGEQFKLYSIAGPIGRATGAKPELIPASGDAWQISVNASPTPNVNAIGLTGDGNYMPRKVEVISQFSPYRPVIARILMNHGISGASANITSAIRVDLDGDGTKEELISATCRRLATDTGEELTKAQKGDYSFVVVKAKSGAQTTVSVLDGAYWYGPDTASSVNELGGALDINGDGRMEVVVRWRYYEGGGIRIHQLRHGRLPIVLAASDGA